MICQSIGFSPISTIGLGLMPVSSDNLVPNPPASITAFIAVYYRLSRVRRQLAQFALLMFVIGFDNILKIVIKVSLL